MPLMISGRKSAPVTLMEPVQLIVAETLAQVAAATIGLVATKTKAAY